jgi:leucine-rich repeat-containing G protein-coupled receptor 6
MRQINLNAAQHFQFAVCLPFETEGALSLTYVVFLMLINGVAFSILMGCYLKVKLILLNFYDLRMVLL